MKQAFKIFNGACFIFCMLTIILLSSCEMYHFAYPLPVDAKSIYKTPKKLRGPVLNANEKKDDYLIEKRSIIIYEKDTIKVINGIWINPRDTTHILKSDTIAWKKIDALRSFKSRYTIKFDSLKNPIDTTENFVIKGDRIYGIENDELTQGMLFSVKGDTLYVIPKLNLVDLGTSAFFRKVNHDFYLLNIRDYAVASTHYQWWQVVLIEKRKNGKVIYHYWNRNIKKSPTLIYSTGEDGYYFDSQWTRKDILKLINEGAFESLNEEKEE